jgi:hypothetical protein
MLFALRHHKPALLQWHVCGIVDHFQLSMQQVRYCS